jgi:hypothetical protein
MTSKKKSAYAAMFEALKEKWAELGVNPVFEAIHVDYEEQEMQAAADAFGLEVGDLISSF